MQVGSYTIDKRLKALESEYGRSEGMKRELEALDIRDNIAAVYHPLHEDICKGAHEFYNLRGGRGSGKSSFCALETVLQIMTDETHMTNALVVRKWAVTLRGSVFSQIQWAINTLGVSKYWQSTLNPMQFIFKPTGQTIKLTGLDDPQKLKSIKPARGYFRILWLEEFSEITGEPELRNLQQSVLRGGDSFIVFRSFNPPLSKIHWANQYCDRADDKSLSILTTYQQIPSSWLGQSFIDEAERLREINERAYLHEYMGLPIGAGAEVFSDNLEVREISDEEAAACDKIYSGIDWGFSSDPCCFLRVSYDRRTETIKLLDEIYETKLSNQELADKIKAHNWHLSGAVSVNLFIDGLIEEQNLIIADSAEPKSIADMRSHGLKIIPCTKFQGCVQYRIRWLQHRKIIVDPERTPNAARELQLYQYDIDKRSGEVLSSLPDKDNHSIDCLAYCLDKAIYNRRNSA